MSFSIEFLDAEVPKERLQPGEKAVFSRITIGDFSEELIIPVNYWSKSDYTNQWVNGVDRLLATPSHVTSALFTEMYNPDNKKYPSMCWPLYKEEGVVYVQNYYEPLDKLKHLFQLEELYSYIPDREIPDKADKYHISEWVTSVAEMREWLDKLKHVT